MQHSLLRCCCDSRNNTVFTVEKQLDKYIYLCVTYSTWCSSAACGAWKDEVVSNRIDLFMALNGHTWFTIINICDGSQHFATGFHIGFFFLFRSNKRENLICSLIDSINLNRAIEDVSWNEASKKKNGLSIEMWFWEMRKFRWYLYRRNGLFFHFLHHGNNCRKFSHSFG